jgi:hypothetical protein
MKLKFEDCWLRGRRGRVNEFSNIARLRVCHSGRAVAGINCLRPLERWDRVGSNATQGMDICLCLFCVCLGSGLATG